MRPNNELQFVLLQKLLHHVGAELDDVAGSLGVANLIWPDSGDGVVLGGVRSQNINHQLFELGLDLVHNVQRPLDGVDLLGALQRVADSAVDAQN